MAGLQCFYGTYEHPPGEVYPQIIEARPVYSSRGKRWGINTRYQCAGDIVYTAAQEAAIKADPTQERTILSQRILELETTYQQDNFGDFGFKFDDGTNTEHIIFQDNPGNLSGNRVLSFNFPHRLPNEYANTRSFGFTVAALFEDTTTGLLHYKETITSIGTGGPDWTYRSRFTGAPVREDIHQQTPVRVIQQGEADSMGAYFVPTAPWWPANEQERRRMISRDSGRVHGHPSNTRGTHYRIRWRYEFLFDSVPVQSPLLFG